MTFHSLSLFFSFRNPDGDVSPWCYIAEHEDGIYWKYCEIPSCRSKSTMQFFRPASLLNRDWQLYNNG